jgi:hypothetical protein
MILYHWYRIFQCLPFHSLFFVVLFFVFCIVEHGESIYEDPTSKADSSDWDDLELEELNIQKKSDQPIPTRFRSLYNLYVMNKSPSHCDMIVVEPPPPELLNDFDSLGSDICKCPDYSTLQYSKWVLGSTWSMDLSSLIWSRDWNDHFYFDLRWYCRSLLKNWSKIISRSHCSSMI